MNDKLLDLTFDRKSVNKALALYRAEADSKAESAGYSGAWDDGGCGRMKDQANAYVAGLDKMIPEFLQPYYRQVKEQIRKDTDPEYAKYLELKKKFG